MNEKLYEEKVGKYPSREELHNFIIDGELTVTITLSEYRMLVSQYAANDKAIKEKITQIYELESKIRNLEAKIVELTVGEKDDKTGKSVCVCAE